MTSTNRLGFLCTLAALAVGACGFAQKAAAIVLYQEDFDTNSSLNLNAMAPDVDNNGGTNTWVAYTGYKQNGTLPTASVNLGAYLPFIPLANNVYTLSASFTGIQTTGTNGAWYALGFGKGVPTSPESGEQRFVSGPTVGRAWMLFRGNTTTGTNKVQIGTSGAGAPAPADWTSNASTNGGDMDMKIVLDTTTTPFKATFYAQRPGDPETQISAGALNIINPADIGAIGIARTTNSAAPNAGTLQGHITTIKLEVAGSPLIPGDVNGDGHVDTSDFNIIRDHLFQSGARAQGDLTNDGYVDFSDFRAWKSAPPSGAGASLNSAVPEPTSALLAMIATVGSLLIGRRRRDIAPRQNL